MRPKSKPLNMTTWRRGKRTVQATLVGVLCASVLGSGCAHAHQHAHRSGPEDHGHHGAAQAHPASLGHSHGDEHSVGGHVHANAAAHTHVSLFGFQVHLPEPVCPSDSPHDSSSDCVLLCFELPALPTSHRHDASAGHSGQSASVFSSVAAALPSDADASRSPRSRCAPPLCDVARHERTGVLLI